MDDLKQYAKYILMIVGLYILTSILIFIGFNAQYSKISLKGNIPEQISIDKAEATKSQGRVYGHIKNSKESNVNGKSIKIVVYDSSNEEVATEIVKINDVEYGSDKLFRINFSADKAASYEISIVE